MMLIISLLAFVIAISSLVTCHELGHFWAARQCGIRVLRFAIGFGKPLWCKRTCTGTEFIIGAIPLGGYVKMLDEREGPVAEQDLPFTFNRQSVLKRMFVIAAGPLANFLLAFLLYFVVMVMGREELIPIIGKVLPHTPAAHAELPVGYEIKAIDDKPTLTWIAIRAALLQRLGETGTIKMSLQRPEHGQQEEYFLPVKNWLKGNAVPKPLETLGITPKLPNVPLTIGKVMPEQPAATAGLLAGDRIVTLNGKALSDWSELVESIHARPQQIVKLGVERNHKLLMFTIEPAVKRDKAGQWHSSIGIQSLPVQWPQEALRKVQYSPFAASKEALTKTYEVSALTLKMMQKMLIGDLSLRSMSGPIGIAEGAGQTAAVGLTEFLNFIALLSISLGVLNCIPIPLLDGGQFLYCVIEGLRGKPVSLKAQLIGFRISVILLITLTLVAFYNDMLRLIE